MESALLGLVVDSSVLVAAERAKLTTPGAIRDIALSQVKCPLSSAPGQSRSWRMVFIVLKRLNAVAATPVRGRAKSTYTDPVND